MCRKESASKQESASEQAVRSHNKYNATITNLMQIVLIVVIRKSKKVIIRSKQGAARTIKAR